MQFVLRISATEALVDAGDLHLADADPLQLSHALRQAEIDSRKQGAHHLTLTVTEADRAVLHDRGYYRAGDESGLMSQMRCALPVLRPAQDSDSAALIALITACFDEYEGCVMDVDGEEPWLREPASAYARLGGKLWVFALGDLAGPVVACGAVKLGNGDLAELKSLYVAASARRRRLAQDLTAVIEQAARTAGRNRMHLWSDTRFSDAHELYRQLGYRQLPDLRELHDKSNTAEMHFERML
ncbi:MAG: GNAT family N-acetyltransferase [Antricoccus sp.]